MSRKSSEKRRYTSARERASNKSTGFAAAYLKLPDGVQLFTPKAGRMLIDILPFEAGKGNPWADPGSLHWERTFFYHRDIGANSDAVLCPRKSKMGKCPICEARGKLMKDQDDDNEELIKALSPKERQLFNIIDLKNPDKGVQIWDFSYHLFGKHLDARLRNSDEDDEWENFFFLEGGSTLKISFEEVSRAGYTFIEAASIDFRARKEDYDEEILEKVYCLDDLLVVRKYDDLKKMFLETEAEKDEDDDEDEDDEPKSKSAKAKSKNNGKDDDDDDDWEEDEEEKPSKKSKARAKDDDDEDEDEEDEPKSKKKKAPKDEDDDWDDFDDDDDEEEKPSKKKSKASKDEDEDEEDDESDTEVIKGKKRSSKDEDDDDDDDEEEDSDEDDDDDEEDEPKKKKSLFPRGKGKVRAGAKDDDDEDEEEEEEDDE